MPGIFYMARVVSTAPKQTALDVVVRLHHLQSHGASGDSNDPRTYSNLVRSS